MSAFETPATPAPPVVGPALAAAPVPAIATLPPAPLKVAARVRRALARVAASRGDADARVIALRRLVDSVRPPRADTLLARRWLSALIEALETHADWLHGLRAVLVEEIDARSATRLFADTGILGTEGTFSGMARRLTERVLPPAGASDQLADLFAILFAHGGDTAWLRALPDADWEPLVLSVLGTGETPRLADPGVLPLVVDGDHVGDETVAGEPPAVAWPVSSRLDALQALQILAYRLGAVGLEPELLQNAPELERVESPFVAISEEVLALVRHWREEGLPAPVADGPVPPENHDTTDADLAHIEVLAGQTAALIRRVRRRTAARGASLDLGYLLTRIQQILARLKLLLEAVRPRAEARLTLPPLLAELARAAASRHSIRAFTAETTELLALRVTANAGQHGEKYIASSRAEYHSVFRSALGAGLVIPFMALIKIWLHGVAMPPFVHGLAYGLNYGLGFVVIYLLHFTVATKQPAMTASFLAHQFDTSEKNAETRAEAMAELVTRTLRSQFVAVLGNVIPAFAIGCGLAWFARGKNHDFLNLDTAHHLLADVSPFSRALFYAAIAGVWLFVSGLVSGFVDNWVAYANVERRLHLHPGLLRLTSEDRAERLAAWVAPNLGGIVGNFVFGLLLGLTRVVGEFLGLPLDIRHVAFGAANVGYASGELGPAMHWPTLALATVGVLAIGLVNLLTSFGLALAVALRARQLSYRVAMRGVGKSLGGRLFRRPGQFFYPPADLPEETATAGAAPDTDKMVDSAEISRRRAVRAGRLPHQSVSAQARTTSAAPSTPRQPGDSPQASQPMTPPKITEL